VHDALAVGVNEGVDDLTGVVDGGVERQFSASEAIGEGFSFEILHHDERHVLVLADVEDRTDVRMRECGRGSRFALEAETRIRIGGVAFEQELDGDIAAKARVVGAVHFAHPAASEEREDFVRADSRA